MPTTEQDPVLVPGISRVGVLETAPERQAPRALVVRAAAALLLFLFAIVTVETTVASLGVYCLTTEPGDVRPLAAKPGR